MRFSDDDSDLVRISDEVVDAGGEIVLLVGRVTDQASAPIEAARVEIWQCDVNGRYLHSGDRGGKARDAAFQGFGYSVADADGRYSFRTIKPVPYPGRTPHIHVKVLAGNRELTTQFYNAGEPRNQNDSLYNWLSDEDKRAVEMRFALLNNVPSARVDIVL
jgi:protocatechuate 3,4-dioxygenase, beta subunit